ncbi:MAG: ABC transporter ATP-binding protein, partial [Deltaproteobacteria bacterium]|nr:ABC transporter ATP-binding protein [Deltaproteobacteria bacterium]
GETLERLVAALVGAGVGVRAATPLRASLEDVFVELTRPAGAASATTPAPAAKEASQ